MAPYTKEASYNFGAGDEQNPRFHIQCQHSPMTIEPNHLEKIRERFTATAEVFTEFRRTMPIEEGERLAELATDGLAR